MKETNQAVEIQTRDNGLLRDLEAAANAFAMLSKAFQIASFSVGAYHHLMHPIWIRQQELRHLRIKEYTLGLTYLEKQRMI
jgi:hypothetical protein